MQISDTLFLSDFDGTLALPDASLGAYSAAVINHLVACGGFFSISSARTPASLRVILKNLHLRLPISCMNGVLLYDLTRECVLDAHPMQGELAARVISFLENAGLEYVFFTFGNRQVLPWIGNIQTAPMRAHIQKRQELYQKVFYETSCPVERLNKGELPLYISCRASLPRLEQAAAVLGAIKELQIHCYRDVAAEGLGYLEIASAQATKAAGAATLKKLAGVPYLAAFGDNSNDISLLAAADYPMVVNNALPELKNNAYRILLSNQEEGVAHFLEDSILSRFRVDNR